MRCTLPSHLSFQLADHGGWIGKLPARGPKFAIARFPIVVDLQLTIVKSVPSNLRRELQRQVLGDKLEFIKEKKVL